jgi:outer membrane protein assembly factor BamB
MTCSLVFAVLLVPAALGADLKEELLAAAKKGDAAAVKALLAKGADVNAKSAYGVTALGFAADRGQVEVAKVLIEHKADVNVKDSFYQATPLSWAASRGHAGVVKVLVEAGAKDVESVLVSAAATGEIAVVRALLETNKIKAEGLTRALQAVHSDKPAVAELLKKAGAKPAPAGGVAVDAATLDAYAGTYRSDTGHEVTILLEGGKLLGTFAGTQKMLLHASDKTTFKLAAFDGVTVQFRREGEKAGNLTLKRAANEVVYKRVEISKGSQARPAPAEDVADVLMPMNWPQFRGPNASGVADGQHPVVAWDAEKGVHVRWKTAVPGLAHSCPVNWGERLFVTTAVSSGPKTEFRPGLYGDVDSVNDKSEHEWRVYCLDRRTGRVHWQRSACKGVPRVKRHAKSSQANCTPATDAGHLVACFGSEGLYCYDHDGNLLWRRDLGTLDAGWFYDADYQWGFGSSPVLYRGRVIVQCDVGKGSFLAAYDVGTGKEAWRTPREELPSWGTPTVVEGPAGAELITNASKFARGYDPATGRELWRLGRHAQITVPTPVSCKGLIFITSGYRPIQPIYAVRPGARGDISLKEGQKERPAVAWSTDKGGPYMPTPIVYGDYLYTCSNAGVVVCYEAKTGKQVYKERLGGRGGYTASPVGADGRLYFTSEENGVRVVRAGPKFELLSVNPMGEPCMATPAVCDGMIFVRTQHHVFGLGRPEPAKASAQK